MALLSLPIPNPPPRNFTFQVELQGQVYRFQFYWSVREEAWYFHLFDVDDALIVAGQKVTVDCPWLRNVVDSRSPPGELIALDTTGEGDPGLNDLGGRVPLVYNEV